MHAHCSLQSLDIGKPVHGVWRCSGDAVMGDGRLRGDMLKVEIENLSKIRFVFESVFFNFAVVSSSFCSLVSNYFILSSLFPSFILTGFSQCLSFNFGRSCAELSGSAPWQPTSFLSNSSNLCVVRMRCKKNSIVLPISC